MVSAPLASRFGISLRLDYYAPGELASVIRRSSRILDIKIEENAVELLAGTSRGTPRIANRLLRRMRDFAQVHGDGVINSDVVSNGLARLEVDALGLERLDREILKAIILRFGGGPVGAETLAVSVSESVESLEDYYEPYLIQIGMLARTPRGRVATPAAYRHLGMEQPHENGRLQF
jgi:Holliday junction DNA helicase RuvB